MTLTLITTVFVTWDKNHHLNAEAVVKITKSTELIVGVSLKCKMS